MSLRRLHAGEWLALAGGAGLLGALFGEWFGLQVAVPRGATEYAPVAVPDDGWASLGRPLVALLLVCVALVVWLAVATVRGPEAQSVTAGVLGVAATAVTFLLLLVRVLTVPGLGIGAPNAAVGVRPGAYAGLAALGLLAAGASWSLRDERPRTYDGVHEPPPARPGPE